MAIKLKDRRTVVIEDDLYVPNMKCNLLSVGQLLEKGFSVNMENGKQKLFDSSERLVLKSLISKNKTFKAMIKAADVKFLSTTATTQ